MSADLEIRESSTGDEWMLTGLASRFNTPYRVRDRMGEYEEIARPGCFRRSLERDPDVLLLVSHSGNPLARTIPSRTLQLQEDADGLRVDARLDRSDPEAAALVSKVRRQILGQMSFSFRVAGEDGQRWNSDFSRRELTNVELHQGDVSVVPFPASPSTEIAIRTATTTEQRRALAEHVGMSVRGCTPSGLEVVSAAPMPSYEPRSALSAPSAPFAPRTTPWSVAEAILRLRKWAHVTDRPNDRYRRAFLWQDHDGSRLGDLKFPVADIVDGEFRVIWRAVANAAARSSLYSEIRPSLAILYKRAAEQFKDPHIRPPWETATRARDVEAELRRRVASYRARSLDAAEARLVEARARTMLLEYDRRRWRPV